MRPRLARLHGAALAGLAAALGGCSGSVSQQPVTTASIPPRPSQGMNREPAPYTTGTLGYTPRSQVYGPYDPPPSYTQPSPMQTGSLGRERIAPPPPSYQRWTDAGRPTGPINPTPSVDQPQPVRWHATAPSAPSSAHRFAQVPPHSRLIAIKEGDTLYSLSRRHRVSVAELVSVNGLRGERLEVGQRVWVPDTR